MATHGEGVQAYFREWSRTYDQPHFQDNIYKPLQVVLQQRLMQAGAGKPLDAVLDVGMGTGQSLTWLPALATHVVGLDYSADMLRCAQERKVAGCGLIRASATDLPLADACMQACISCFSIHWWPDIAAGLAEMFRVTRPGGVSLVMIPSVALLALMGGGGFRGHGQLVHWLAPSKYAQMARKAGWLTRIPVEVARGAWLLEARRPLP